MSKLSRWAIVLSAALLAAVYVLPVWRIHLVAPQYPEGIGMLIRVNTITGLKPNDLNNINGLNHYIGMKAIDPEAIPVLDAMPVVLGALVVTGVLAAAFGRRWAGWAWLGLVATAGALGLFEFWSWSYDYGHNLDPNAIITIPGMSYQPPLLGSKQLLNFTATSWPAAGGILAGVAFVITLAALLYSAKKRPKRFQEQGSLAVAAGILLLILPVQVRAQSATTVVVSPAGPVRTLADGLSLVKRGGRVIVKPGVYLEHGIRITRPVEVVGEGSPVIDGEGKGEIILVTADSVALRGLHLKRVGVSYTQDRAAIRVSNASGCDISRNRIDEALYGIYLAKVNDCRIELNQLSASGKTESTSGNGIHLWTARGIRIAGNTVRGYRDGIYFEFVHDTEVIQNVSEGNIRYGLHFMYSDDCWYTGNTFRKNGSGVAVMYTNRVHMTANRFEDNWGSAAYGLLLKEINDSRLERNVFVNNTSGLIADGANRIQATANVFERNGWAINVEGSTVDGRFRSNTFLRNTFDVTTNSRDPSSEFEGNYWDEYRGYDLDRDGIGDVPHPPVRMFAVIVERSPQAIVLLRSALVALLDAAERAMPVLTPRLLVDPKPAMRRTA